MFIDSHAHIYQDKFKEDIEQVIQSSIDNGVERIYMPNVDSKTTASMLDLETRFPQNCFPAMGLHPCSVKDDFEKELAHVEDMLSKRRFAAIGEMGIDLYWDTTFKDQQIIAYKQQIEWAKNYKLPIIIHSRDALQFTIEYVEELWTEDLTGVYHCFNGTIEQMEKIISMGFYIGLGGVITFKNANLDEMIKKAPLENILLETDAPYLAPTPHRGKRNESSFIPIIAQKIADIKELDLNVVAEQTTKNALKLFAL